MIGQGAFGVVLKGVAAGINHNERYVPVAVKTVKCKYFKSSLYFLFDISWNTSLVRVSLKKGGGEL